MKLHPAIALLFPGLLALVPVGQIAHAGPAEFHAYLLPALSVIAVDESANVNFEVDESAQQFNGYRITIRYNPRVVDFLAVVEGSLMTGACGQTIDFLSQPDDSTVSYEHAILCGGLPLNGPGVLSTFVFRGVGDGLSPLDILTNPDQMFTDAGVWVNPKHPTFPREVILREAAIQVGSGSGIDETTAPGAALHLAQNLPNPFRDRTAIPFELLAGGPVEFTVHDGHGRRLGTYRADFPAGRHLVHWDAVRPGGLRLANGIYFYRLAVGNTVETRKMVVLP